MKDMTLVEWLVVVAIFGIVAAIAFGSAGQRFKTRVIDGCEYIITYDAPPTHKGNCTNAIHAGNQ